MKAAYIRDAVALIEFSEILATSMANGDTWTELKAAETLEKLRSAQKYAKGPSFSPISAYGSNGGTKGFTSHLDSISKRSIYILLTMEISLQLSSTTSLTI